MVVLHVDLRPKPGAGPALERSFRESFLPAVRAQQGFVDTALLRPTDAADFYRLVIAFESEALRTNWVGTELHQQVWPKLETNCTGYEAGLFDAV